MIRIATIGTSKICDNFLKGMQLTGRFRLSAVYSRNAETGKTFAEKHGCEKVFTDLEKLAKWDGIDAVYIASPNSCHTSQSRIFLENGKNVLCEKPIVTASKEYIELKGIADENKAIYMEAIIPRHVKNYKEVKAAVGNIGKVLSARLDFSQRSSRMDAFLRGEKVNIFDMSLYAGTLMDLGVYCVYAAVDFFGKPKSITADAHFLDNGADGSGTAVFLYDDFSAVLSYDKTFQGDLGSEISGENGTVKIKYISQYAGVSIVKNGEENKIVGYPSKEELMSGEAEKFADYIEKFDSFKDDYKSASELCLNVHQCMDEIKNKAKISYK